MPIYEYLCLECDMQFQSLVMKKEEEKGLHCPGCGSHNLRKLISKAVYHVSEDSRIDLFNPNARQTDGFYKDSRNIGLSAKKMAKSMGIDTGGRFDERLEKLRTDPASIIKDSV
ncbi:MAG: hypothetical protein B1H11_00485 [Desulfobacteraceae bacterium 4484_190.1]|nr:MAG: hypothetical protein B1H11_00485 [Desulfobacteraceae bacterium 4484_190.1]